mmetsp:Transcript_41766/g.70507  ORF Transcript_41766/g.70507 Transcript_41766/m.70507 type:complete len:201 (+) Transcript_41766:168-770(+)
MGWQRLSASCTPERQRSLRLISTATRQRSARRRAVIVTYAAPEAPCRSRGLDAAGRAHDAHTCRGVRRKCRDPPEGAVRHPECKALEWQSLTVAGGGGGGALGFLRRGAHRTRNTHLLAPGRSRSSGPLSHSFDGRHTDLTESERERERGTARDGPGGGPGFSGSVGGGLGAFAIQPHQPRVPAGWIASPVATSSGGEGA